jgi:hypothetical protein
MRVSRTLRSKTNGFFLALILNIIATIVLLSIEVSATVSVWWVLHMRKTFVSDSRYGFLWFSSLLFVLVTGVLKQFLLNCGQSESAQGEGAANTVAG